MELVGLNCPAQEGGKSMNKKVDIKLDNGDVIVMNGKKVVFRAEKTKRNIDIANSIYLYHKYNGKNSRA